MQQQPPLSILHPLQSLNKCFQLLVGCLRLRVDPQSPSVFPKERRRLGVQFFFQEISPSIPNRPLLLDRCRQQPLQWFASPRRRPSLRKNFLCFFLQKFFNFVQIHTPKNILRLSFQPVSNKLVSELSFLQPMNECQLLQQHLFHSLGTRIGQILHLFRYPSPLLLSSTPLIPVQRLHQLIQQLILTSRILSLQTNPRTKIQP